jgi:AraC family transcriptional regulator
MARDHGGRYLQHREQRWQGLGIELARWQGGPATEGVLDESEHLLFVTLGGATERTEATLDGGPRYAGADFPGAVSFIPAGRRRKAWHGRGVLDYVTIRLPSRDQPGVEYAGFTNTPDPLVRQLAVALRGEAAGGGVAGELFVDAVATTLSLHLLRRYSNRAPRLTAPTGLSGARLRAVVEHIADHLDGDLRLERLAGLVGMDRHHFSRAFRQAVGQPPHRYVTEQRVTRATELLAGSDLPIAEIAHLVGLSSQSHLTTVFRKHVGATPHAYRTARR